MRLHALLLLSWGLSSCLARSRPADFCFGGCQQALRAVQFNDTVQVTVSRKQRACESLLGISSLYLCAEVFCSDHDRQRGLEELNQTCHAFELSLPPVDKLSNYTDEDIKHLRRLQPEEALRKVTTIFNEVVIPSERLFRLAYDTLVSLYFPFLPAAAYFETKTHREYGFAMYMFWFVVVTIGMFARLTALVRSLQRQKVMWEAVPDEEHSQTTDPNHRSRLAIFSLINRAFKRYVMIPATFGYRCSQNIGWCTIPPRIQSMTIASFIAMNIYLSSTAYHVFPDNMYWPEVFDQYSRYVADRTGIISLANMPLIWLFGTRNNALLWVTGWDFATYSNFHRWVARIATVQAAVHSVAYTISIFKDGGWPYFVRFLRERYFFNGEIATVAMVAICCFSVYGLRRSYYEMFLFLHIILSVILLITMWYHVEIFHGEYNGFIWPCVYIWLFDRALRLFRILSFNIRFWTAKATTTYHADCDIVRITVPYSSSLLVPQPGAFYYLYILNSRKFWESHPFTLAYATNEEDSTEESRAPSPSLGTINPPHKVSKPISGPGTFDSITKASCEMSTLLEQSNTGIPPSMTFIIRPYDGFTRRLQQSALHTSAKPRVLVEGPYGHTIPLYKYRNILFIAGGTGVAMPLSYITNLLSTSSSKVSSVHIVWAVREHEFLDQVIKTDFRGTLDDERLTLTAYVTRPKDINKDDEEIPAYPKALSVLHGRPNIRREVADMAKDVRLEGLAVVACGPGMMADDARAAVVGVLKSGVTGIDYFEESFNW